MLFLFLQIESVRSLQFWLPRILFSRDTVLFPSLKLSIAATFPIFPSPFAHSFRLFLFGECFISLAFCISTHIILRIVISFFIPEFDFFTFTLLAVYSVLIFIINICTLYPLTLTLVSFFISYFMVLLLFIPLIMIEILMKNR